MIKKRTAESILALGALGVVFGDIGTSPIYALGVLFGRHGLNIGINQANIYGVISLIIWSLIVVVCVKYIGILMRLNNEGEGGIMALTALLRNIKRSRKTKKWLIFAGIVGVALFYGDCAITPAISVLSSIEGLNVVAPGLKEFIIPITVSVLLILFALQRFGTSAVSKLFGPIMLLWFLVIGIAGLVEILQNPSSLRALNPAYAVSFFVSHPWVGFLSMSIVVLAITGAEALYADMGHFGRRPIAKAWFVAVFPALILCYVAQGSLLLTNPEALSSPFFYLFPSWAFVPVVILATFATLIASQSAISGAYSLTRQAVHLGFLPNIEIRHTSDQESGQIYIPIVNAMLLITVLGLVITFGSSSALAGAFGVAISGALLMDTILLIALIMNTRRLSRWNLVVACLLILPLELLFAFSNLSKIPHGGWFPIVVAILMIVVITTWRRGEYLVGEVRKSKEGSLIEYVKQINAKSNLSRIPGEAIYVCHHPGYAPLALHASVDQLKELHNKVLIISVDIANVPHISATHRFEYNPLGNDHDKIMYLNIKFGYHDSPNVPHALEKITSTTELNVNPKHAHYFVSLAKIVPKSAERQISRWRRAVYMFMVRNRRNQSDYLHLPVERTIDIESLIEI